MRSRLRVWVFGWLCIVASGGGHSTSFGLQPTQGAGPAGPPSPITSQPGQELFPSLAPDGTLAYSRTDGSDWDVYVQRRGASPVNLTADSSADDWQAEFSPDGKWLVFRSEREGGGIYIMDSHGGAVKRLISTGFNPTWSADGTEVAYSSAQIVADPAYRPIQGTLDAVKVATGERRSIYGRGDAVQPRWSPNGQRIAFWAFASQGGQRDLWTIPALGGEPVAVTRDAATDWNPVWSPDGKYLYFASDRRGSMEIWRVPIDEKTGLVLGQREQLTSGGTGVRGHIVIGGEGTRLLYIDQVVSQTVEKVGFDAAAGKIVGQSTQVLDATVAPSQMDVSPDGQWLVFYSGGHGGDRAQEDLYLSGADGGDFRRLTNDAARDRGPAWSPDGKKIAFFSDRIGNYEIWTINPDGTGLTQLTRDPGTNRSGILWSPDGSRLLYLQRSGPTWETYVIDPAKRPFQQVPEQLPAIGSSEYFAATSWSPDGQKIAGSRVYVNRVIPGGIFIYTIASKTFQMLVDRAAGARWLSDSRRLIYPDSITNKIFLIDTQSPTPREIFSVAPRNLGVIRLTADNKTVYFHVSTTESDIWQVDLR